MRWLFALLIAAIGCDQKSPDRSESPAASPRAVEKKVEEVRGSCVGGGRVVFNGTPPPMKEIENKPCHNGAPTLTEETVVVGKSGGLANVFVRIEGLPSVDGSSLPPVLLDQVHCRYVPHAIGVCVGQKLRVRSSDDTMHNVHWDPQTNPPVNFGMTRVGAEQTVNFKAPEFIKVRCDVHPWMSATIGVFENPFFVVTDGEGSFEIRNLPAGTYKLIGWHERYGQLEQEIELKESAPVEVEIVYKAP